jgi:predicted amino acid racemase
LGHAADVVALADESLNSEIVVLRALGSAAEHRGTPHDVVVMVDLGDLREGVWPDDLPGFLRAADGIDGIRVIGLGANLTCFGGVLPTRANMTRLVSLAEQAEQVLGRPLSRVSGGNSSALPLVAAGGMPARVDELRVGEAILLGRETGHRAPWPGTTQDAVVLHGEVVERKTKPSVPVGPLGEDAMGHRPVFEDRGMVQRALVNLGVVDADVSALTPLDPRVRVLGGSSDYLVLDVTGAGPCYQVGDGVAFGVGCADLATAASSPCVEVRPLPHPTPPDPARAS